MRRSVPVAKSWPGVSDLAEVVFLQKEKEKARQRVPGRDALVAESKIEIDTAKVPEMIRELSAYLHVLHEVVLKVERRNLLVDGLWNRSVVVECLSSLLRDESLVPDDREHILKRLQKESEISDQDRRRGLNPRRRENRNDALTPSKSPPASCEGQSRRPFFEKTTTLIRC